MAWGSTQTATQRTSIAATEVPFEFAGVDEVLLNPGEQAHCQVAVDFPTTPADDATVSVYGTLDGSTWDTTPVQRYRVDKATDPGRVSFVVAGLYAFRVGVAGTATTTLTSADLSYRKDGVDLS